MPTQPQIANAILKLLHDRGPNKTICPSEVARHLYPASSWRKHMDDVRQAAQSLVDSNSIIATQKGRTIDLTKSKGPIRLKLAQ